MACIEIRPAQLIACTCIGMSEFGIVFFIVFFSSLAPHSQNSCSYFLYYTVRTYSWYTNFRIPGYEPSERLEKTIKNNNKN